MGKVRQAVIMVGGKGTRLRPLTDTCPKPILPVLDRPCLDYLVESLAKAGIEEIILACGYRSEQVPAAIGDGSDRNISIEYSYEDVPMGTAGAIKILEDRLDDVFVAVNGDMFAEIDVKKQIEEHFRSNACITIALTPVENPCEFGIARTDETGRILEFKEKPKPEEVFSNLINAGLYVVSKDVMELVPKDQMYDFSKELVTDLIGRGRKIQGHRINGLWRDVGRPSDLLETNIIMAHMKDPNSVYTGKDSKVAGSVVSEAVISRNSTITDSEITRTLIMEGSSVKGSKISGSIIGKGCSITDCIISNTVLGDGEIRKNETIGEK